MRFKVSSLNLGLVNETCIICPEKAEKYFISIAKILEDTYSVKTFVYVYDRDPFTKKVASIIKQSFSNIFTLTGGVVEASIADPNHPFRQIYAFTQKFNINSISLSSIDNVPISYDLDFPEEMNSFLWLHRKDFPCNSAEPEELAESIFKEIRLHHSRREKRRLEKLRTVDEYDILEDYEKLLKFSALILFSPLILYISTLLISIHAQNAKDWVDMLIWVAHAVGYIAMVASYVVMFAGPPIIVAVRVCRFQLSISVSTTFAHFRERTTKRITIAAALALFMGVFTTFMFALSKLTNGNEAAFSIAHALRAYLPISIFMLVFTLDLLAVYLLNYKTVTRISFARNYRIYLPISVVVYIVAILIAVKSVLVLV